MKTFDYGRLKNPQYFRDGRMDAHSDHLYCRTAQEAADGSSSYRRSLSGPWKFHYAKNYGSTIPGFEKADYPCMGWDDIYVPAHIQMEGYDVPHYANVQYPWEGHDNIQPGEIPERFNPVASYVKYFYVPEDMRGKRLFISFQGAESGLALWLNGQFVGYSGDSFTPSEFELTDYIADGENKLTAQVFKWTSGSWCEDQDFYRFSGLYRDVYLFTVPDVHVYDLQIRAVPEETLKTALLEVAAETWGNGMARVTLSFDGEVILRDEKALGGKSTFSWEITSPALWSAEEPRLYDLTLEVFDNTGNLQEVIPEKVGFRRFEMKGGLMCLNGKRIVFRGVNRHDFSSVGGRHVTEAELQKDLRTMKQNNINAIRTCHYPDASLLYRLCDEYGLYLIAETNLETHGTWAMAEATGDRSAILPGDRPEWLGMLLDRADSMFQLDKNHPSILIWSCGNESSGGKDIYEISQSFRRKDPTRLVHYEGVTMDRSYNGSSDMESQMYPAVESIREFLANDSSKPFICCEYAHAMGNSCGAMHKYTDLADTEPGYQGGFLWDYIDQSICKKDRYGREFQAYGGDFGERPTDYNFSGNGIVYGGERDASPKMQEVKFNYQSISALVRPDSVRVINKNLFVNTDAYECRVSVARDGAVFRKKILETAVPPLGEKTYPLYLKKEERSGEYTVTVSFHLKKGEVWADAGHEVAFGQYIYRVGEPAEIRREKPGNRCEEKMEIIRSPRNIGIQGMHFQAIFSVTYGGIVSYKYAGREMLEAIPRPNFWRAPTDNDCGNLMAQRYGQWKLASMYLSHKNPRGSLYAQPTPPEVETGDGYIKVTYTYLMPTVPASQCKLSYEVSGDGSVKTTLCYDPAEGPGDMPEFGVMFKLNADYDRVQWYGLGPQETYADRKHGAKLGIYENKVLDNVAKYLVPQECGAKEEVRWAKVTDRKGRGMLFEMDPGNGPMVFSALPWTPHEMENAAHPYELPEIHYTVVRAALAQMGVGGDDSWGAKTHPEYLIKTDKKLVFSFRFKGL